jgi:hypothetical protein
MLSFIKRLIDLPVVATIHLTRFIGSLNVLLILIDKDRFSEPARWLL